MSHQQSTLDGRKASRRECEMPMCESPVEVVVERLYYDGVGLDSEEALTCRKCAEVEDMTVLRSLDVPERYEIVGESA